MTRFKLLFIFAAQLAKKAQCAFATVYIVNSFELTIIYLPGLHSCSTLGGFSLFRKEAYGIF